VKNAMAERSALESGQAERVQPTPYSAAVRAFGLVPGGVWRVTLILRTEFLLGAVGDTWTLAFLQSEWSSQYKSPGAPGEDSPTPVVSLHLRRSPQ